MYTVSNSTTKLVKVFSQDNDLYMGYIEVLKRGSEIAVCSVIRFNHLRGLPKITIEEQAQVCTCIQEAENTFKLFKKKIEDFLSQ